MRLSMCPAFVSHLDPQQRVARLKFRVVLTGDNLADRWGNALLEPFEEVGAAFASGGLDWQLSTPAAALGGESHEFRVIGSDDIEAEPLAVLKGSFVGRVSFTIARKEDGDTLTVGLQVSVAWSDLIDEALTDLIKSYRGGGSDAGRCWLTVAPAQMDLVDDGVRHRKAADRQGDLLDGPAANEDGDTASADAPG